MSADVVKITGGYALPVPGEPVQNCIEVLEEALEQARAGDIVGVVIVRVYPAAHGYIMPADISRGGWFKTYAAVGALHVAAHDVTTMLLEKDD